jgi:hypothetical protein
MRIKRLSALVLSFCILAATVSCSNTGAVTPSNEETTTETTAEPTPTPTPVPTNTPTPTVNPVPEPFTELILDEELVGEWITGDELYLEDVDHLTSFVFTRSHEYEDWDKQAWEDFMKQT